MRLKTTLKLFFQNLNIVWKVALYKLFTFSLTGLFVWLSAMPIINQLSAEGFFQAVKSAFEINQNTIINLSSNIAEIVNMFFGIIKANWNTLSYSIFMLFFVVTFFSYFINALADVPVCDMLYGSMSCNANFGFCSCYVRNFKRSLIYSAVKMITQFVVDAIIMAILLLLINLCTASQLLAWLAPCLAVVTFVVLFAFRQVLFACFAPNVVINDYNVFKSLAKGVKLGFKHFFNNFATASVLVLILFAVHIFFAIFSFGASLIITIPSAIVLMVIFNMVVFYSSTGMYYYVGENNIQDETKGVKRLEQQDTIKDLKHII